MHVLAHLARGEQEAKLHVELGQLIAVARTRDGLRRTYEISKKFVTNATYPAECVVERRLQEVEQHNLQAEPLSEVPSSAEAKGDSNNLDWVGGQLVVKKLSNNVALPVDSEGLRRRIMLLGASFSIPKMRFPTKTWLETASADVWSHHCDYILGERVAYFGVTFGGRKHLVDWGIVVGYELMHSIVYQNLDLEAALESARANTELREEYFTAPAMMATMAGAAEGAAYGARRERHHDPPNTPYGSSSGKGKGVKGRGKGKRKNNATNAAELPRTTPDGKQICFAFNNEGCKEGKKCTRAHVCRQCFGQHKLFECKSAGESDGKGR